MLKFSLVGRNEVGRRELNEAIDELGNEFGREVVMVSGSAEDINEGDKVG